MNKLLLTTAFCLIAGMAQAGGSYEQHGQPPATVTGQQSQGQMQGQLQGQRQGQIAQGGNAAALGGAGGSANARGGRGGAGGSGGNTGPVTVNNTTDGGGYNGGSYASNYSARGNTPDVILGSVSGGNPCGLAAGAGGAFQSVGAAFQKMWEGDRCQTNEDAKLLYNVGLSAVAKERLCESTYYSNAFARAGQPCAADVQRWRDAGYRQERGGWVR